MKHRKFVPIKTAKSLKKLITPQPTTLKNSLSIESLKRKFNKPPNKLEPMHVQETLIMDNDDDTVLLGTPNTSQKYTKTSFRPNPRTTLPELISTKIVQDNVGSNVYRSVVPNVFVNNQLRYE